MCFVRSTKWPSCTAWPKYPKTKRAAAKELKLSKMSHLKITPFLVSIICSFYSILPGVFLCLFITIMCGSPKKRNVYLFNMKLLLFCDTYFKLTKKNYHARWDLQLNIIDLVWGFNNLFVFKSKYYSINSALLKQ